MKEHLEQQNGDQIPVLKTVKTESSINAISSMLKIQ